MSEENIIQIGELLPPEMPSNSTELVLKSQNAITKLNDGLTNTQRKMMNSPEYQLMVMKIRSVIACNPEFSHSLKKLIIKTGLPYTQVYGALRFENMFTNKAIEFIIQYFQINPIWLFTNQENQKAFLFSANKQFEDAIYFNTTNIADSFASKKIFDLTTIRYFKKCELMVNRTKGIVVLVIPRFTSTHYATRLRFK